MKKISKKMKEEMKEEAICKHCIVKRKGRSEEFDERKIYSSCYAACLSAKIPHTEAEKICDNVSKEVKVWAHKKVMMTSEEIFKKTTGAIKKHDHKAAYLYETHRDIA